MSVWSDIEGYPIAQVIAAFEPFGAHQLALQEGEYVVLLAQAGEWYKGALTTDLANRGIFPKKYVTVVSQGVSARRSQPKAPTISEEPEDADDDEHERAAQPAAAAAAAAAPVGEAKSPPPMRRGSATALPPKPPPPTQKLSESSAVPPPILASRSGSQHSLDEANSARPSAFEKAAPVKGVSVKPGVFRDEYGFAVDVKTLDAREVSQKVTYAQAQRELWQKMIAKAGGEREFFAPSLLWDYRTQSSTANAIQRLLHSTGLQSQLTRAIRVGVPGEMRERVWWLCSGAWKKQEEAPVRDQYSTLLERLKTESSRHSVDIEKDLYRTFPQNSNFESEEGVSALRRVLSAYALRNPDVGYCQSMNFLTAILLLHFEEEKAFWMLAAIIEDILPPDFYTTGMLGCRVDQHVFTSYLAHCTPRVHEHLQQMGAMIEPITMNWFLCLFVNTFPLETTLRIWDLVLYEGSEVLVRAAATIIRMHERNLLAARNFSTVYAILKTPLQPPYSDFVALNYQLVQKVSASEFMTQLFDKRWCRKVSNQGINHLRQTYEAHLERELDRTLGPDPTARGSLALPGSRGRSMRAVSVRMRSMDLAEVNNTFAAVQRQVEDEYEFTTPAEPEPEPAAAAEEEPEEAQYDWEALARQQDELDEVGRFMYSAAGDTGMAMKTHIFSLDDEPLPEELPQSPSASMSPSWKRPVPASPALKTRYAKSRSSLMSLVTGMHNSRSLEDVSSGGT